MQSKLHHSAFKIASSTQSCILFQSNASDPFPSPPPLTRILSSNFDQLPSEISQRIAIPTQKGILKNYGGGIQRSPGKKKKLSFNLNPNTKINCRKHKFREPSTNEEIRHHPSTNFTF